MQRHIHRAAGAAALILCTLSTTSHADTRSLPIADAHIHYSHDSVELTPPERVVALMRAANLKFALVSSSDDNGTQLLSDIAPDLIVPGLRPYRRRGETGTWFRDEGALEYVETLLATNRYATIGEFHLFGDDADLPIPRRIVALAVEHNLVLHAHSDAEAVERLLAQHPDVKVLWAHSGFDGPEAVAAMLAKHDRLWADLAFRSDVGRGGSLSPEWIALFTAFPDRMMLGTDTYTPERMYFLPEHASNARRWLAALPTDIAEGVAWRNAFDLLMPHWQANRATTACELSSDNAVVLSESPLITVTPLTEPEVSQPFSAMLQICGSELHNAAVRLDGSMPSHGHGMNYDPEHTVIADGDDHMTVQVDGLVLHMPGTWAWQVELRTDAGRTTATQAFSLN